jgi:hypothetical protein
MTATERFFEMARKKALPIVYATGKPYDAAISKKRPSLKGCVLADIRVVKALAGSLCYLASALSIGCLARTATQSRKTHGGNA